MLIAHIRKPFWATAGCWAETRPWPCTSWEGRTAPINKDVDKVNTNCRFWNDVWSNQCFEMENKPIFGPTNDDWLDIYSQFMKCILMESYVRLMITLLLRRLVQVPAYVTFQLQNMITYFHKTKLKLLQCVPELVAISTHPLSQLYVDGS